MSKRPGPISDNREALDHLFHRLHVDFGPSVGEAVIRTIIDELGGIRVTVPDHDEIRREARDRQIRCSFNGQNYEELSLRFGLSRRQIRYIVQEGRK